jgi:glycogen debranching enzyme
MIGTLETPLVNPGPPPSEFDLCAVPRPVFDARPDWIELYDLAWSIAAENMEKPGNPGWLPQMSCMPGSGKIWQWDSCFMALFSRYSNGILSALNNLDNLYRLQRDDGYISMAYDKDKECESYGERINPPIYAWVEFEHYKHAGDRERLARIYPVLKKYFLWVKANRRRENGLYYFEDTGSSGMDNSPRSGYYAASLAGSDVCFVDLSCQQQLAANRLAAIAGLLKKNDDAAFFREEAGELSRLINRYCWSERTGFYYDCFTRTDIAERHNFLSCKTAAAFWTILSGAADDRQLGHLVDHLLDPGEFGTPHPVPSLSRKDPNYSPDGGYWLGGVWAPANYMIVRGLSERGRQDLAREIAIKHVSAMSGVMTDPAHGGIWEAYSPEYPRPATVKENCYVRDNFVGWSGLGPIAMFIENIIGLGFDAPSNTISWRITERGRHGLENMDFNGKKISLVCEGRRAGESGGTTRLQVECDGKINLKITIFNSESRRVSVALDAGTHQLTV